MKRNVMEDKTALPAPIPNPKGPASFRSYVELFFISFLVLFFELVCIRWVGSYTVFLAYFTNIVLIASFLGISVGCLAASRKTHLMNWVPPLTLLVAIVTVALPIAYLSEHQFITIDAYQHSPERIYFGTGIGDFDLASVIVPLEVIAGFFFAIIAIIFVGVGQVMGRCLEAIPNRVLAYTTNIVGSLVGIVAFAVISYFWISPFWWFAIASGGCGYFLKGSPLRRATSWAIIAVTVLFVGIMGWGVGIDTQNVLTSYIRPLVTRVLPETKGTDARVFWSPYYQITYRTIIRNIKANNAGHQQMDTLGTGGIAYVLPYAMSRDAKRPPIEDVLVIGAGSGNDVSAALWAGADHVDGVEIDPLIQDLGRRYHPDRPFQDPRVSLYVNDGRNFLKQTDSTYDLIVYGVLDSLVLHSGYSSLRLENFLFTRQAFSDVRARLKDDGIFVTYTFTAQGWIVLRLARMAQEAFGRKPLVFTFPYRSQLTPSSSLGLTMMIVGDTDRLEEAFKTKGPYWIRTFDFLQKPGLMGYGFAPPSAKSLDSWEKIGPVDLIGLETLKVIPDDTWPFLYTKERRNPGLNLKGMAIMGGLSLILLFLFAPPATLRLRRFSWNMFFLGAGFMLLEAKGVTHMALLFGSTWIVNSIVFFAILVMILLSNLFVLRFRPTRLTGYYAALAATLVLNIVVDLNVFLGLPRAATLVGSSIMFFIPIFFAGVIFASVFRVSARADRDFGANIAGVVLGGLAENFSLVLGYKHLLWLAIVFYLLSMAFQPRLRPSPG